MDPSGELFWLIKWGRKTPQTSQTVDHPLGKEFWIVQDWKKKSKNQALTYMHSLFSAWLQS